MTYKLYVVEMFLKNILTAKQPAAAKQPCVSIHVEEAVLKNAFIFFWNFVFLIFFLL